MECEHRARGYANAVARNLFHHKRACRRAVPSMTCCRFRSDPAIANIAVIAAPARNGKVRRFRKCNFITPDTGLTIRGPDQAEKSLTREAE
jgi:hypothetical protein